MPALVNSLLNPATMLFLVTKVRCYITASDLPLIFAVAEKAKENGSATGRCNFFLDDSQAATDTYPKPRTDEAVLYHSLLYALSLSSFRGIFSSVSSSDTHAVWPFEFNSIHSSTYHEDHQEQRQCHSAVVVVQHFAETAPMLDCCNCFRNCDFVYFDYLFVGSDQNESNTFHQGTTFQESSVSPLATTTAAREEASNLQQQRSSSLHHFLLQQQEHRDHYPHAQVSHTPHGCLALPSPDDYFNA
jgi:hypothetical protein